MSSIENSNLIEDYSGVLTTDTNPYNALIKACGEDSSQIQHCYQSHRETRNELQKAKLLDVNFPGWIIDPILEKLINDKQNPKYVDPRHCLVFWARPPEHLRNLINALQTRLLECKHDLWLMPLDCLHMTTLEIAHSLQEPEIESLLTVLGHKVAEITDYTFSHRARLVKPLLSYDNQALALSFLPASSSKYPGDKSDEYTYHHLRRDIYELSKGTGVNIASRYTVPSAHLTIARFVTKQGSEEHRSDRSTEPLDTVKWIQHLERINAWLQEEYWSENSVDGKGCWVVGEEKGLDCRKGTVWYGGGTSVRVGRGF